MTDERTAKNILQYKQTGHQDEGKPSEKWNEYVKSE
jgi:hypothetical protein